MLVHLAPIEPLIAIGVVIATAGTDAVYVLFSAAVSDRRPASAATWSSVWYLLSSFAVISYTSNWEYVCFAAVGSWIGAYASMSWLQRSHPPLKSPHVAPPVEGRDGDIDTPPRSG